MPPTDDPTPPAGHATRLDVTLGLCALVLAGLFGASARLTHGFEAWTYEELRRRDAADGVLHAPAMRLRDAQGQALDVFDGAPAPANAAAPVYLVNFVYTRCPSVCQVLGSEYFRMQEALRTAGPASVKLLSVSIDPRHDDRAALAAHARLHKADPALWVVAAPRGEDEGRAVLRGLGVVAIPDGSGGYVHNGSIHLIDPAGRVRRVFDDAQWPQALEAAASMARQRTP